MIGLLDLYDMIHTNSSASMSLVNVDDMFVSMRSDEHNANLFNISRSTYHTSARGKVRGSRYLP